MSTVPSTSPVVEATASPLTPSPGGNAPRDRSLDPVDVAQKPLRGGVISMVAQVARFILQMASVAVLARLLLPADFGLQGMVVAITSVIGLFSDIGLGAATIQRNQVSHAQLSTVFWINLAVGAVLALLTAALAPVLAAFYHEPRLLAITLASSVTFLIGGATAQHAALLQRRLAFGTMAIVDVGSLTLGTVAAIGLALLDFGYWALVIGSIVTPVARSVGLWFAVPWRPSRPTRQSELGSMLRFGGTVSLNTLVVYVSYNVEKVLLGRSWGSDALGLYGRAYQLLTLPLQQLHTAMYAVAFPALSRIQDDPVGLRRAFLRGYNVLLSITLPMPLIAAIFATEIVAILLGPKWAEAASLLRLLTPTVVALALINPFGWLVLATGQAGLNLKLGLLIAPVVILGIALGLPYGPRGVAVGYSVAMTALILPISAWAISGTQLGWGPYLQALWRPLLSGSIAGAAGLAFELLFPGGHPIFRLLLGTAVVLGVHASVLLFALQQRSLYSDLVARLFRRRPAGVLTAAP